MKSGSLLTLEPLTVTRPIVEGLSKTESKQGCTTKLLTVVVGVLEIHVDNSSRPNPRHLGSEQHRHVTELAWPHGVAAVFGEEDGDIELGEILRPIGIARLFKVGIATPFVDVEPPEIGPLVVAAAVKVGGDLLANPGIVVRGIAHRDRAIVLLLDVGLHVADGGFDEGTGAGGEVAVGDLVASEEAQHVSVVGEGIDDRGVPLVQIGVPDGRVAIDGLRGLREIGDQVDAGICKHAHALAVVLVGIDGIDAHDIGSQLLQQRDIALAARRIGERVDVGRVRAGVVGIVG